MLLEAIRIRPERHSSRKLPTRPAYGYIRNPSGTSYVIRDFLSRRADSTDVTAQPITQQEFVAGEIRGVVALIEDEGLGVDARDEAFAGREEFLQLATHEVRRQLGASATPAKYQWQPAGKGRQDTYSGMTGQDHQALVRSGRGSVSLGDESLTPYA